MEIETKLALMDKRINDLEEKTDKIESLVLSVQELAFSVKAMATEQQEQRKKQEEFAERLISIENQPDKSKAEIHDKIKWTVVSLVIGALVGFLLKSLLGI